MSWKPCACPPEVIDSSLRFSFSRYTTLEDIEWAIQALHRALERVTVRSPAPSGRAR